MQNLTLKAVKKSTARFEIAIASIDRDGEGKHKGILTIVDKERPRSKYEASSIHITGRNKDVVIKQMQEIAGIFPPKADAVIIDLEELKSGQ